MRVIELTYSLVADYEMTQSVHSDTYLAIHSSVNTHAGKAIFITGASKGLGQAMAISFAKSGASKIAIGARSSLDDTAKKMRQAAVSLYGRSPEILSLDLDVSDIDSVSSAELRVRKEFGRLDILINNAGIVTRGLIAESNPHEWQQAWQVNLIGPYLMLRSFIPLLLEGGDKTIINVSSVGAHCTTKTYSAYETSKLAILRLTEFACVEYGDAGLLSYSIHPGNVPTNINGGIEGIAPEMRHGKHPIHHEVPECG